MRLTRSRLLDDSDSSQCDLPGQLEVELNLSCRHPAAQAVTVTVPVTVALPVSGRTQAGTQAGRNFSATVTVTVPH